MKILKQILAICGMMAIVATTSCVDERYDLDNVSGEMHLFENGITMPLLQTGDMFFGDLISSEDEIVLNEKGVYEFGTNKDRLNLDMEIVNKVSIPEQNPDFGLIKTCKLPIPTFNSTPIALPSDITDYVASLLVETEKIDSRVTCIEKIYTHDEWISTISLSVIDASGAPFSGEGLRVDMIKFDNYRLELPSVLILDKEKLSASGNIKVSSEENSNVLILDGEAEGSEIYIYVKVNGFNIGDKVFVDNKIVIDEDIKMSGNISLTISNEGPMAIYELGVKPALNIPEVYMDEVLGNAILEAELEKEIVRIGSLPEFLESSETSLVLTNPYVPIVIETTIPMDYIYADIELVPRDANGDFIYDDNGQKIEIKVDHMSVPGDSHDTPGPTTSYEYIACQRIPELDNLGYDFVECPELGKITKKIPSYIEVSGRGYTDPAHIYDFYIGEFYHADLNYEVRVPFMVEQNTCIIYEDETTDLNADIFENLTLSSICLNADILNGFPAEMSLEVEPFDVNGNKIDGVEVIIPTSIKASETTELTENVVPARTKMKLEIKELTKGELQKIDQLKWRVKVLFPDKGLISKYQSLNMKISLELPEGIAINMDNL